MITFFILKSQIRGGWTSRPQSIMGHSIGMNSRATHRYKMRAVGSRPSARPKHWQPVNGSQFIIKLYYRPTSSSEKNAFFLNQPTRFPRRGMRGIKRLFD